VSNQTTYKPGHNQSGIGLPVHGMLATIHAAAYIAANCPESNEYTYSLESAIYNLRLCGREVCREVERIRNEIQNAIGEANERTHE
jgi:succinate dehydrogenase/fumarate reductase flavoprotein subunit